MSSLMGGQKTKVPASGFFAMPKEYQDAFNQILGNVNSSIPQINAGMFRPLSQTDDETNALQMYREGFAPDENSISRDIQMQMNPFNNSVIDEINRQAVGQNSILKQSQNAAGQLNSNRGFLGANDIDLSRQNQIGGFLQNQFNTSLNNALTTLPNARRTDAAGLLGIGDFQRNLDSQNKTAPLQALSAQTGLIGSIPSQFGQFGSPQQTVKTGGGLGGFLGGLSTVASLAAPGFGALTAGATGLPWLANAGLGSQLGGLANAFPSDRRLKENIIPKGEKNGFPVYEYNYIGHPKKFIGVMADEVEKIIPDAVHDMDGFKAVDYSKLGFEMEAVNVTH